MLRQALKRSGERRRERHLPSTQPEPPVRALRMTEREARAELDGTKEPAAPRRRTQPYRPLTPVPAAWKRPGQDLDHTTSTDTTSATAASKDDAS